MSRFLRYLTHCSTREEPHDQHQPTSDRCALPDWTLRRARSSQDSDAGGASSRVESRRFHLTRPDNRRLGQGAISARRRHCPRHPRRDSAGHRQTALRPYDPFRHYSVVGAASRLFAQWRAYRGRRRSRCQPGEVHLRTIGGRLIAAPGHG